MNVKQTPSHVRSLGPHTWTRLTLLDIHISVKQTPKLALLDIYISVKQTPSHVRSLGPHTWTRLTLLDIYISVK